MGDTLSQISRPTGGPGLSVTYGPGGVEVYDTRPGLILAKIVGTGTAVGTGEASYDAYAWQEQVWDSASGNWVDGARSGTVTNRPAYGPNLGHINNNSMYPIPADGPDPIREIIVWLYPLPDESAYLMMLPPEAGSRTPGLMSVDTQRFSGKKYWHGDQHCSGTAMYFNEPTTYHSYLADSGVGLELTSALPPSGVGPTIPIAKLWLRNDADIGLRLIHMSTAPSTPKACYQITEPDASTIRKGVWGTAPTGMVVSGGIVTALGSGGTGTVTSVGFAASPTSVFGVSGSPITSSGTISLGLVIQNANTVLAGPASGPASVPVFRSLVTADLPAGTGTVTSVALAMPTNEFQVIGSPITSSGTLSVVWNAIPANRVMAGPTDGADGTPFFRALVTADLPAGTLAWSSVPASATASGVAGEIARDTNYLYICVADNTWKRVALATW